MPSLSRRIVVRGRTGLAAVCLFTAAPAAAQEDARPAVHVIATGGTIAATGSRGPLTGEALVRAIPAIDELARITVEQFANVGSSSITPEHWLALSRRIEALYRDRPELRGIVVTHGTDTMEETAYFLDLTVADRRPVVVTGAMRVAAAIGADGPANLYNAVRLAAAPAAVGRGTLILMNDQIFEPRTATKTNTTRVEAFEAPGRGPIGVADPDDIIFEPGLPVRAAGPAPFDLVGLEALPRVDVVYSFAGADGTAIRAAAEAGARGIVVATVGRGNMPPAQAAAVREAAGRGIVVVLSSRTGGGRVPVDQPVRPSDSPTGAAAVLGAGALNPPKARILLMLGLTTTREVSELAALFRSP